MTNPIHWSALLPSLVGVNVGVLVVLLTGLTIIWKRPSDRRAQLFYICTLGVGIMLPSASMGTINPGISVGALNWSLRNRIQIVDILAAALSTVVLAPAFLHFCLVFPQDSKLLQGRRFLIHWIYALPLLAILGGPVAPLSSYRERPIVFISLALALGLGGLFAYRWMRNGRNAGKGWLLRHPFDAIPAVLAAQILLTRLTSLWIYGPRLTADLLHVLIFLPALAGLLALTLYPLGAFLITIYNYRHGAPEARQQLRWPFAATLILALTVVLNLIVGLGGSLHGSRAAEMIGLDLVTDSLEKVVWLLVPLAYAFAILKYRLLEIDLFIRRTVVYGILTGVLLVAYYVLAGGLGALAIRFVPVSSTWVTVGATLGVAALFLPVKNRVQRTLARHLFHKPIEYPAAVDLLRAEAIQAVSLEDFLQVACGILQRSLQCRSVAVLTRGSDNQPFLPRAAFGLTEAALALLRLEPLSGSATEWKGRIGLNLHQANGRWEAQALDLPASWRSRLDKAGLVFFVPVIRQGCSCFLLCVGGKLSRDPYDQGDEGFLAEAAAQLATGASQVLLREEQLDLEGARRIQQGLLPRELPRLHGYEMAGAWQPSGSVAGDYYDVLKLSEFEVGLCIADVAGKGMPAALLMSNLQAAVNALAAASTSPKELCQRLNGVVHRNAGANRFITFFYGRLDARSGTIRFANAGHNAPLLIRIEGPVIPLTSGGTMLGPFRDAQYGEGEVRLSPGDWLVLYTDGITEARDSAGHFFGEERLVEMIRNRDAAPREVVHEVLAEVTRFSAGHLEDDATLLLLRAS